MCDNVYSKLIQIHPTDRYGQINWCGALLCYQHKCVICNPGEIDHLSGKQCSTAGLWTYNKYETLMQNPTNPIMICFLIIMIITFLVVIFLPITIAITKTFWDKTFHMRDASK